MKKTYRIPEVEVLEDVLEPLMGVSADNGIGYGGVDREGSIEPSAKSERTSVWDEED